jgi:hypothetical protein
MESSMKNCRSFCVLAVVFGVLTGILFINGPAWSADTGPAGDAKGFKAKGLRPKQNYIGVNYWYWTDADVDGDKGAFSVNTARVTLGYSKLFFNYRRSFYTWKDKHLLPFGNGVDDPWDDLQSVSLGLRFNGPIGQDWRYFSSAAVTSSYEDDFGPLAVSGVVSFSKPINDNMRINLGVAANYHVVDTMVLPVFGISYNEGGPWGAPKKGFSASIGIPDTSLTYHFNSMVATRLALGYDRRIYKLRDNSPVSRDGYVKDRAFNAGLYLDLNPVDNLSISVGVLHSFARELEFYDRDENKISNYDVDGSLGGSIRVTYNF